ncbi:YbaY family lipoprotein [Chloroflexota bacterium]
MMKIMKLILALIFCTLLLAGCQQTASVTGSITYREKIALPSEGVVITIKVEDVSLADAPAVTIGEQIIENPEHQVPIPFEVKYDRSVIDERNTYGMRVRIEVDGKLWFTNTSHYGVITQENPTTDIEVILENIRAETPLVGLEDVSWVLDSYGQSGNLQAVLRDTKITAEFKEGQVAGSAGCNRYFGAYELNGRKLSIVEPPGLTRMACPEQIMDQEQAYLKALQDAESVEIEDSELRITSGKQVLVFRHQSPTDEEETITATFHFNQDTEGWTGGFSDLPVRHEDHGYDVEFRYSDIPVEGEEGGGLMLYGNNHSDDLFMYTLRAFDTHDGLSPNARYEVQLSFDLATNVPPGMMGIGGSPGESVYIKAGVVSIEPESEEDTTGGEDYYRINIDKGNQSSGGEDMIVLGDAAKGEGPGQNDESFQYKPFNYGYQATTNENGELWVIIGADSGFEGISQLYFDNISITFNRVTD